MGLHWIDVSVVALYMFALGAIGVYFANKQTTTEAYFVAKRSIPAWALGMSMLATIISAVTFIAYPGSGYAGNWSNLVPGFMAVAVLVLVGLLIIPFYRHAVRMSVYEYFELRFRYFARAYASVAFAVGTFTKMAFVLYLLALTMNSMTQWPVSTIIIIVGVVTIGYTLLGGLQAVIWADVIQGFILWAGILICIAYLLFLPAAGPAAVLKYAAAAHKFDLGSGSLIFSKPTIIVLSLYGLFFYLQKYTADQTMIQRYLAAKGDSEAIRGVALGALLCLPVWALFMLIGSLLWAFYRLTGEMLPKGISKADQVFPYFITTHLPHGLAGLFIASLFGAAMATLSSDLNCLAVVAVEDFYRRWSRHATDKRRLRIGKLMVAVYGIVGIMFALQLARTNGTALSLWYTLSAIVAGGLAGLFLLAFFCSRVNWQGVYIGIIANLLFTAWASLTLNHGAMLNLGRWNFPLHEYMIGVIGNVLLLLVGYSASAFFPKPATSTVLTWWDWRRKMRSAISHQPSSYPTEPSNVNASTAATHSDALEIS